MAFLSILMIVSLGWNVYFSANGRAPANKTSAEVATTAASPVVYVRQQVGEGKLIHPLLMAERMAESPRLAPLKPELMRIIQEWEADGKISSVSVYMASLNNMDWIGIGSDLGYLPGSLMKVPILMYYLKEEQRHPGTLKKEFVYERPRNSFPQQNFMGDSILPGHRYKISELLRYMIAESDNNATWVLSYHIDQEEYRKIFLDLDIPPYEVQNTMYSISPRQYSKFFRVLYSSTYLDEQLSEYALELLSDCNFRDGIVKELPKGTVAVHKFGERGIDYDQNFCESAIIYYKSNPYLLTIMTKGRDVKKQTSLVSELSKEIYRLYGNI